MFSGEALMEYAMNGVVQERRGNQELGFAPHNCYRCSGDDRWVTIAVGTQEEWLALCTATGNPQWASDSRFSDPLKRWDNHEALDNLIERWTETQDAGETAQLLQNSGVSSEVSLNGRDLAIDPHLHARNAWGFIEHPTQGRLQVPNPPWKFSETPATIRAPSPLLGQDNVYVLEGLLGANAEEINQWSDSGILD